MVKKLRVTTIYFAIGSFLTKILPFVDVNNNHERYEILHVDKFLSIVVFGFILVAFLPLINFKTRLGCYQILKGHSLKSETFLKAPYKAAKHLMFDDYEFYHPAFKDVKLQKIKDQLQLKL